MFGDGDIWATLERTDEAILANSASKMVAVLAVLQQIPP
jgi:hypothetical protein